MKVIKVLTMALFIGLTSQSIYADGADTPMHVAIKDVISQATSLLDKAPKIKSTDPSFPFQAEFIELAVGQKEAAERVAYGEEFTKLYATMVAQGDAIKSRYDIMGALGTESNRLDLMPDEKLQMIADFDKQMADVKEMLEVDSLMGTNVARAMNARNIDADGARAAKLMADPEDPKMSKLAKGTPEQKWEFMNAVGKLADRDQIIRALQNAREVDKWDIATEFVNNNLLSSPDTHILNIVSGLVQTQWKPATMLLRGINMLRRDKEILNIWLFFSLYYLYNAN